MEVLRSSSPEQEEEEEEEDEERWMLWRLGFSFTCVQVESFSDLLLLPLIDRYASLVTLDLNIGIRWIQISLSHSVWRDWCRSFTCGDDMPWNCCWLIITYAGRECFSCCCCDKKRSSLFPLCNTNDSHGNDNNPPPTNRRVCRIGEEQ